VRDHGRDSDGGISRCHIRKAGHRLARSHSQTQPSSLNAYVGHKRHAIKRSA